MLNKIWPIFLIISFIYAIITGTLPQTNNSIFESIDSVINLTLTLIGTTCLWSGIMEVASKTKIIYYLAKMLTSGEDPRFIARRLIVVASEDVGNADFRAMLIAEATLRAVEHLGMPEARIPLAQATEFIARAKKSNRAIMAIDNAINDIKNGLDYLPPDHLRDAHYKDASKYGFGVGYIYTHDNPTAYQQFMPNEIKDKKYFEN